MSDDFRTPEWLLRLITRDQPFFDPCPIGGSEGLERLWPSDRLVFVNPPYSDPAPWVARAGLHDGPIALLLRVDTSAAWWTAWAREFHVIFIGQRLRFEGETASAPFASAVWLR